MRTHLPRRHPGRLGRLGHVGLLGPALLVLGACERAPSPPVEAAPAPVVEAPVVDLEALAEEARRQARISADEARVAAEVAARRAADSERAMFDQRYPMHGIAFHFLAPVKRAASASASNVGYLRRGSRFRASARIDGPGCTKGWHELPGAGFVCRGEGVLVGSEPQSFEPSPVSASLEDAMPYPYAFTPRDGVPQFARIPTPEEESAASALFAAMDARASAAPVAAAGPDGGVAAEPAAEADVEAPPPPGQAVASTEPVDDGLPDFLRMRMDKSFYVSVDGMADADDGRRFVRTVRGGFVRESALSPNEPPTRRGVALGGAYQLPVAFVYRVGAHKLRRDATTAALVDDGVVEQHTSFPVAERIVHNRNDYVVSPEGMVVRATVVRIATTIERPAGVPEGSRFVHVDLSEQTLVAYEDTRPVFATTVSTGREGFATPTGTFRIQSKHVSTTMDDLSAGDEAYSIEDVPWTMYFEGSYALHGAFWHSQFGRVRSHGCVNLAPADARWVFFWSTPTLPASWHGVFATSRDPGTYVVITP